MKAGKYIAFGICAFLLLSMGAMVMGGSDNVAADPPEFEYEVIAGTDTVRLTKYNGNSATVFITTDDDDRPVV